MPSSRSRILSVVALTLSATQWGCDDGTPSVDTTTAEATVKGTVMVRGKPMAGGEITFDGSNMSRASTTPRKAPIAADGTYTVTTLQGRNSARISGPALKKEPQLGYGIHTIEVKPGENTFNIELPPE